MKKLITIEIEASGRYCNNFCQFMSVDAKRCNLFEADLVWHYKKKENGNLRPAVCRLAEEISRED